MEIKKAWSCHNLKLISKEELQEVELIILIKIKTVALETYQQLPVLVEWAVLCHKVYQK